MSTQRYISTSFWTDKWIRSLDPSERYLYMYLLTNPQTNIAGIYQITLDRIAFDTGYDERTLVPMFEIFRKAGKAAFIDDEWIILPSWPKHQRWEIKATIKKGIESVLNSIPKNVLAHAKELGYTYPIDSLLVGYTYSPSYSDLDSDTDTDTDSEQTPDKPAKSPKHKHGEYCHVLLTSDEYLRLCEEWGEQEVLRMIKILDEGIETKGYKYKNHYLALRKWKEKDRGVPIPKQKQEKKTCPVCGKELSGLFCMTCMIQYNEKMEETL